ncbi:MAG: lactonase family protein [Actinobacteria bacterium]|nr:lactonase family protein [Actinomycetota bacterium]
MNLPRLTTVIATAAAAAAFAFVPAATASATSHPSDHHTVGAVFVQTDDPVHNAVIAYDRSTDGRLTRAGTYRTGGAGAQEAGAVVDPLASQGSLTLDRARDLLFAVNGGSDTVTVFGVHGSRLDVRQILPTHGDLPVSVSVVGNLVFVLNARDGGSITGYRLAGRTVVPLSGSTRALHLADNGNPEFLQTPSQVAITPDRHAVVVATKTHGTLLTFPLDRFGRPAAAPTVTTSGAVPFALSFDRSSHLVVIDASGLVTSYRVHRSGSLAKVSSVGPTGQAAACWSVVVRGTVYVANAGSNSISTVADRSGHLRLLDATAAHTDGGPVDLAASGNGRFIYQLSGATGKIDEYRRSANGSLTSIGSVDTGLGSANGHPLEGIAAS